MKEIDESDNEPDLVARILEYYPRIYFACHTRHVIDLDTGVTLTANQASILDHLDLQEPITLLELATHMGVTPSTMSITLGRLAQLGYVEKVKDPRDKRKVGLTLSGAGAKIKNSKSVLDPDRVARLLAHLNESEQGQALTGLALLARAADVELKETSESKFWNRRNHEKDTPS